LLSSIIYHEASYINHYEIYEQQPKKKEGKQNERKKEKRKRYLICLLLHAWAENTNLHPRYHIMLVEKTFQIIACKCSRP